MTNQPLPPAPSPGSIVVLHGAFGLHWCTFLREGMSASWWRVRQLGTEGDGVDIPVASVVAVVPASWVREVGDAR